jgi:hypothetical protein
MPVRSKNIVAVKYHDNTDEFLKEEAILLKGVEGFKLTWRCAATQPAFINVCGIYSDEPGSH